MGRSRSNSGGSFGKSKKSPKKKTGNKKSKAAKHSSPSMGSKKKGLTPFSPGEFSVSTNGVATTKKGRRSSAASNNDNNQSRVKKTTSPKQPKNSSKKKGSAADSLSKKRQRQTFEAGAAAMSVCVPPSGNNSKKKGAKAKKKDSLDANFGLQLPSKHAGVQIHAIPWMAEALQLQEEQSRNNNTPQQQQQRTTTTTTGVRLPTHDVHPQRVQQLSHELRAFGNYVRLTRGEVDARQNVVKDLTRLVRDMPTFYRQQHIRFGTNNNKEPHELEFRPFGSYAAPAVCSFLSDIDLALWGAVPMFPIHNNNNTKPPAAPSTPDKNSKQREREQRWKDAMAMFDLENGMSPGNHEGPSLATLKEEDEDEDEEPMVENDNREPKEAPAKKSEEKAGDDGASPLFVIDRVGDGVEDDQALGTDASSPQASKKTGQFSDAEDDISPFKAPAKDMNSKTDEGQVSQQSANDHDDAGNDSDQDSADKLEGFGSEQEEAAKATTSDRSFNHLVSMSSSDDEENDDDDENAILKQLQKGIHEDEYDDDDEFNDMEVGFIGALDNEDDNEDEHHQPIVPTAETHTVRRRDALDALVKLDRKLRRSRSPVATSLNFIRHARVPIIKFMSEAGVEVDISIGGLNSADTSLYAASQCERYESFAPVVLALKIIMGQHELDTPFTGGLGSFKLYVLVAHHIQRHIELGGSDEPGEIFLSFLFRYGSSTGDHCVDKKARTGLFKHSLIKCDGGFEADFSNVFRVAECCHLFGSVWRRLWARVRQTGKSFGKDGEKPASLLAELIHIPRLTNARQKSLNVVSASSMSNNPYQQSFPPRPRSDPPTKGSKFTRNGRNGSAKSAQSPPNSKRPRDKTASEIAAGYGVTFKGNNTYKRTRR